jgi:hypothetical protein
MSACHLLTIRNSGSSAEIKNLYKPIDAKRELKMSRAESARENGKLGGRPKGSPNKVTHEIRSLALLSAPDAFAELVRLSKDAQSEQVRVAATKEILDRAYGRAPQSIDGDGHGGPLLLQVITGVPRGE